MAVEEIKANSMKPVNGLTKKVVGDIFDEWKRLDGHSFTAGFLVESLRTNDEEYKRTYGNRPVKDITSSDISKGRGFVSEVLRCIVSFVDSTSESDIYSTILKIPGTTSMEAANEDASVKFDMDEKALKKLVRIHNIEVEFYNNLVSTLEIPHIKVFKTLPWVIGESQGVLHMEDMTEKGGSMGFMTFNIPQITEIVRHLAHMHKICLTSDEKHQKLWKEKFNENQCTLNTFVKMNENYKPFLNICGDKEFFEPLLKKYQKFGSSMDYNKYVFSESWKDLHLESVLVHGDLYGGNMMWKLDEYGNFTNQLAAIYDWQIMHEGSPMADIARVLTTSVDGYIRRQAEEFIVEFYHDLLEKEIKQVGKSCPYTVEQLKKAYNYIFVGQCYSMTWLAAFYNDHVKENNENIQKAKIETIVLRSKHALEDMDRLLTGPMKHVFERFG